MALPALATIEGLQARGADVCDAAGAGGHRRRLSAHPRRDRQPVDRRGQSVRVDAAGGHCGRLPGGDPGPRSSFDVRATRPFQESVEHWGAGDAFLSGPDKADLSGATGNTSGLSVIRTEAPGPHTGAPATTRTPRDRRCPGARRSDGGHRDRLWTFCRAWLEEEHPDFGSLRARISGSRSTGLPRSTTLRPGRRRRRWRSWTPTSSSHPTSSTTP